MRNDDGGALFGNLDEALMVELCWKEFDAEVGDYLDFCRFRAEASELLELKEKK